MLFIILSHFSLYGNWKLAGGPSPFHVTKLLMFDPLGPAGAIIFFIITGYFTYKDNVKVEKALQKELKKSIKIWGQAIFYSVVVLLFLIRFGVNVKVKQIIISIFPFTLNEYWFVSAYIILCLISPYLIVTINNISYKSFQSLLLILMVLNFTELFGNELINNLLLAVLGFLIGAYVKKNPIDRIKISWLVIFVGLIFLIELLSIFTLTKFGVAFGHAAHFSTDTLAVLMATGLFILFSKIDIGANHFINIFASTVFATYLITEQVLLRPIIWSDILNVGQFQDKLLFPLYGIIIVIIIMIVSFVIDMIRQLIIRYIIVIYAKAKR